MNALDALKSRMAFQPMILAKIHQESPVVAQMERTVKRMLGGRNDVAVESPDRVLGAVQAFLDGQQVTSVVALRRLSYGLSLKTNQLSIFDSPRLTAEFFGHRGAAGFLKSTSGLKRTYHGVLVSYFSHPWGQALDMKRSVSAFLQENLHKLEALKIRPAWVDLLITYPGILTESPYKPFAQQALEHHFSLKDELKPIGIPESSWLIKDFVLGAVTELTALDDAPFENRLREILRLIESHESVFNQCFKLVLERYAGLQSPREHAELKALALKKWGVPWLRSNSMWQTVTENAKNLVSNWIKSEFVEAFFSKLSEDWNSDTRRYAFWKKYIPFMRSVEFGLTGSMMRSPDRDLVQLREKLRGLYSEVVGYNVTNAVIMRFDDFVAVEFGTTSNAAYFYEPGKVPFDIGRPLSIQAFNPLKRLGVGSFKWSHNGDWETRFETDLMHKYGLDYRRISRRQVTPIPPTVNPPIVKQNLTGETQDSSLTNLAKSLSSASSNAQRGEKNDAAKVAPAPDRVNLSVTLQHSNVRSTHTAAAIKYFTESKDKPLNVKVLELFAANNVFSLEDRSNEPHEFWLHVIQEDTELEKAIVARGFTYMGRSAYWIYQTNLPANPPTSEHSVESMDEKSPLEPSPSTAENYTENGEGAMLRLLRAASTLSMATVEEMSRSKVAILSEDAYTKGPIWIRGVESQSPIGQELFRLGLKYYRGNGFFWKQPIAAELHHETQAEATESKSVQDDQTAQIPTFIPVTSRQSALARVLDKSDRVEFELLVSSAIRCGYLTQDLRNTDGVFWISGLPPHCELAKVLINKGFFVLGSLIGIRT